MFDEAAHFQLPFLERYVRLLGEVQYQPVLRFVLIDGGASASRDDSRDPRLAMPGRET